VPAVTTPPQPSIHPGPARRAIERLVLVREGEWPALLRSAAYFFFLLSSYYILRPIRETLGIDRGADDLPWLMTGTLLAMLAVNPAFAALVARLPRRTFIPWTYRFFALNLLAFYALLALGPAGARTALGYAFYIWVSVFNLFAVSVFWAVMADIWRPEQSKRLFGFIGVGGTLGAMAGAAATASLAGALGIFPLLLVSAALLELAVRCALPLLPRPGSPGWSGRQTPEPGPGVLRGMELVSRSPYLLTICLYLFLYTILSTFLYLEQGGIITATLPDRAARTALFARIDLWVNILTVLAQVFLTGRIVRGLGIGPVLALTPAITALGFAALWAAPRLGIPILSALVAFQVVRRGMHYAMSRPSREMLFTVLGQDERYKSKPFIDTFVYRAGDMAGAWSPRFIVATLGRAGVAATAAIPLVAVPISLIALGTGLALGRMQRRRARQPAVPAADAPA
jgi:AAA family ATP:ADP antiporter